MRFTPNGCAPVFCVSSLVRQIGNVRFSSLFIPNIWHRHHRKWHSGLIIRLSVSIKMNNSFYQGETDDWKKHRFVTLHIKITASLWDFFCTNRRHPLIDLKYFFLFRFRFPLSTFHRLRSCHKTLSKWIKCNENDTDVPSLNKVWTWNEKKRTTR